MFADAAGLPLPQPFFSRTDPGPRIAEGFVDAVLVDITRPESRAFRVRVYDPDYPPPAADVVAAFLLYGTGVKGIARRLEAVWNSLGLRPIAQVRSDPFRSFDHSHGFAKVLRTLEALQPQFPP